MGIGTVWESGRLPKHGILQSVDVVRRLREDASRVPSDVRSSMSAPHEKPDKDPGLENLVLAAEVRHQKRRNRARWIYTRLDELFYPSLLLGAVLVIKAFIELVLPYLPAQ